uniref:hypothetical protein n=1 Tax=Paenibacillus xylanexedens TaxID=528191 RepID=UPI001C92BFA6
RVMVELGEVKIISGNGGGLWEGSGWMWEWGLKCFTGDEFVVDRSVVGERWDGGRKREGFVGAADDGMEMGGMGVEGGGRDGGERM